MEDTHSFWSITFFSPFIPYAPASDFAVALVAVTPSFPRSHSRTIRFLSASLSFSSASFLIAVRLSITLSSRSFSFPPPPSSVSWEDILATFSSSESDSLTGKPILRRFLSLTFLSLALMAAFLLAFASSAWFLASSVSLCSCSSSSCWSARVASSFEKR